MDRLLMRFAVAIGVALVAAVLFLSAVGFLTAALYLQLASHMTAAAAATLTGLAALVAMVILLVAGRLILARPGGGAVPARLASAPTVEDTQLARAQIAQALSALLGEEIGRAVQEHPKGSAAMALAAGLAVGISPDLRGLMVGLIGALTKQGPARKT
jgi:hypothetical protein